MRTFSIIHRGLFLTLALLLAPVAGHAQEAAILTPHHTFPLGETPTALAFSADGRFLLAGDEDGRVVGWDVERKRRAFRARLPGEVRFLSALRGDSTFVGVDEDGAVSVGKLRDGTSEVRFRAEASPQRVALDAGRRYLAIATGDERIALFDVQAGMTVGRIDARGELDDPLFLGFDRLGEQLVAVTERGDVVSWNPRTQRRLRTLSLGGGTLHGSRSTIHAAATNRTANVFVVALEEVALPKGGVRGRARPGDLVRRHAIIAYDWESGVEIKRVSYPGGRVKEIALGPGSDHVAVAGQENNDVTLVDLRRGELGSTVTASSTPEALAISGDDHWLAVGTEGGRVAVWKMDFREPPTASTADATLPTLSGRLRVLSEKQPALPSDTAARLAVLPFTDNGNAEKAAAACSDALATQLAGVDHLTLLERQRIDEVLNELNLQASDLTASNGARLGKLLGADYLVLGSLNALGRTYLLNARLLRVETAQVVEGRQVICEECRFRDVFDAIHLLGTTLAQ